MIIGYFGNVRQGKTLSAVKELKKLYDKGYTIYSNTWLAFPFKPLTMDFLLDIVEKNLDIEDDPVAFFIDEMTIFLDSRVSGSKRSRIITYMLLQTGKLSKKNADIGILFLFTAQFPHSIDKRLRHLMDVAVECEKLKVTKINAKYFIQKKWYYKGFRSACKQSVFEGTPYLYSLYDTRKRITVQKDRYAKDEISISVGED